MFYCHKPFPKQLLIALAVQNISIIRNNVYVVSMFFSIGSFTTVALIPETNKHKQSSFANKRHYWTSLSGEQNNENKISNGHPRHPVQIEREIKFTSNNGHI